VTAKLVLIVGANSGIAKALCQQILARTDLSVIRVARQHNDQFAKEQAGRVININCDQSEQGIAECAEALTMYDIQQVFICTGFLHDHQQLPEKKLVDFNAEFFHHTMQVNCVVPSLWLTQIGSIVRNKLADVVVFSARVGSISDN
jgi:NAD(P)-dependent dehydrogenase (short-subunit alcohol dehydrogenase family)